MNDDTRPKFIRLTNTRGESIDVDLHRIYIMSKAGNGMTAVGLSLENGTSEIICKESRQQIREMIETAEFNHIQEVERSSRRRPSR